MYAKFDIEHTRRDGRSASRKISGGHKHRIYYMETFNTHEQFPYAIMNQLFLLLTRNILTFFSLLFFLCNRNSLHSRPTSFRFSSFYFASVRFVPCTYLAATSIYRNICYWNSLKQHLNFEKRSLLGYIMRLFYVCVHSELFVAFSI